MAAAHEPQPAHVHDFPMPLLVSAVVVMAPEPQPAHVPAHAPVAAVAVMSTELQPAPARVYAHTRLRVSPKTRLSKRKRAMEEALGGPGPMTRGRLRFIADAFAPYSRSAARK
jgi:hypothetical protein